MCISCKILEHIVLSHVSKHLSSNNIIIDNQHGFREKRSCETQLTDAVQDWSECLNRSGQTDVLLLDFSKAFDRVPHQRLAVKLRHYGIDGRTLNWIQGFLHCKWQRTVCCCEWFPLILDASKIRCATGFCIGTLFLIYINDIADEVNSTMRLFADDSILYREIKGTEDQEQLQQDLNTIFAWADKWQMSFNASKCQLHVLTITHKTKPKLHNYTVSNQLIEKTYDRKYLGVTISSDLTWKKHIASIRSKASSTLGVIRCDLGPRSKNNTLRAYQALVRPQLEYTTAAWNPHTANDIKSLEAIQRQAVRFICGEYGRSTSITPLLDQLDLDLLATSAPCSLRFITVSSISSFHHVSHFRKSKSPTEIHSYHSSQRYIHIHFMLELYQCGTDYPRRQLKQHLSTSSKPQLFR